MPSWHRAFFDRSYLSFDSRTSDCTKLAETTVSVFGSTLSRRGTVWCTSRAVSPIQHSEGLNGAVLHLSSENVELMYLLVFSVDLMFESIFILNLTRIRTPYFLSHCKSGATYFLVVSVRFRADFLQFVHRGKVYLSQREITYSQIRIGFFDNDFISILYILQGHLEFTLDQTSDFRGIEHVSSLEHVSPEPLVCYCIILDMFHSCTIRSRHDEPRSEESEQPHIPQHELIIPLGLAKKIDPGPLLIHEALNISLTLKINVIGSNNITGNTGVNTNTKRGCALSRNIYKNSIFEMSETWATKRQRET